MVAPSDLELLERWCSDDRVAGDALVARHFDALYRFFRNKLERDVDDLIQRTFLACVESKDRVRNSASFRSYLFAIARNELFGHFRKQGRRDAREVDLASLSVADLAGSPISQHVRSEEERLLLAALRAIPVDLQIAIELFYWEDLSTAELADILGIPAGTVKSRLRRAREVLAAMMLTIGEETLARSTVQDFERWARAVRGSLSPGEGSSQ